MQLNARNAANEAVAVFGKGLERVDICVGDDRLCEQGPCANISANIIDYFGARPRSELNQL
jgi:hypothetical protein